MKVAILAGGMGSRLSEETVSRPKPMVEIGGKPILWHIMKYYASFGFSDFSVALGYRGDDIKRFFIDNVTVDQDFQIDVSTGLRSIHSTKRSSWKVNLIETGPDTETGGRIKRLRSHLGNETFMLTWGDGLSNIDLNALLAFHKSHGKLATLSAVRPPARFGRLDLGQSGSVEEFSEKPQTGEGWINGAFFVLEPGVFDYIDGDTTSFERGPLVNLACDKQLMAYQHEGFWQCMDTLRDRVLLENLWSSQQPPWKTWQ